MCPSLAIAASGEKVCSSHATFIQCDEVVRSVRVAARKESKYGWTRYCHPTSLALHVALKPEESCVVWVQPWKPNSLSIATVAGVARAFHL